MKKVVLVLAMLLMFPLAAFAQDSKDRSGSGILPEVAYKEVLTLKRDYAQERILRLQAELSLLQIQFREGQMALQAEKKNLDSLNATLKGLEKPEKEKKK
jgi:hypothetical protein